MNQVHILEKVFPILSKRHKHSFWSFCGFIYSGWTFSVANSPLDNTNSHSKVLSEIGHVSTSSCALPVSQFFYGHNTKVVFLFWKHLLNSSLPAKTRDQSRKWTHFGGEETEWTSFLLIQEIWFCDDANGKKALHCQQKWTAFRFNKIQDSFWCQRTSPNCGT